MPDNAYEKSGVNISEGNQFVEKIKDIAKETTSKETLSMIGGFSGAFEMPEGYKNPVITAATDGVGTKLKIAIEQNNYEGIGIDLVAMCVNDLIVNGSKPIFFLDYYSTGKLQQETGMKIIKSIIEGCKQSECTLLGGETAEMPDTYKEKDFDLAGFAVGIVEKDKIINGEKIIEGDVVYALPSSGLHSNGFSLVRKIIETVREESKDWMEQILTPTTIYTSVVQKVIEKVEIKAMSHITGGGIIENLPRTIPEEYSVEIKQWNLPPLFSWIQEKGNIKEEEMFRTFNCGIGYAFIVSKQNEEKLTNTLKDLGEKYIKLGKIINNKDNKRIIFNK